MRGPMKLGSTLLVLVGLTLASASASGQDTAPPPAPAPEAPAGKIGKLPHVTFDATRKQVRLDAEALAVDAPLEFFMVKAGTAEHEAVLRTPAQPAHIHAALLAVGLKPGQPLTYIEATEKWIPPQGPPLHVTVEWEKDGRTISYPAYRLIRDIKNKKEPKAFTWIFAGSRVVDGRYVADDTGYVMTVVNFDFAMIDIPELASNNNEFLEWERNADLMPPKGTKVTVVIEPAGKAPGAQAEAPVRPAGAGETPAVGPGTTPGAPGAAEVADPFKQIRMDEAKVEALVKQHDQVMAPRADALRKAAETHYEVISALRKEQQRLVTEADLIQRTIDELERKWADLTAPRPAEPAPR